MKDPSMKNKKAKLLLKLWCFILNSKCTGYKPYNIWLAFKSSLFNSNIFLQKPAAIIAGLFLWDNYPGELKPPTSEVLEINTSVRQR